MISLNDSKKGVSFIIPAFNEELLLPDCIKSIKREIERWRFDNPDYNFEIIVVDNNSTDATAAIAYSHNVIVIKEPRKGLTHARQAGYQQAQYDYQAYIDADNAVPPGWLDNLQELKDPNTVCISGPPCYNNQSWFIRLMARLFYVLTQLSHKYVGASVQGGNFVLKKWALDKIGGHSVDIEFYGEDTDLAMRLSHVGKIKLLPKMWIYSSDRRYVNQGIIKTVWIYAINYFSVHFIKKPITLKYKDFRVDTNT